MNHFHVKSSNLIPLLLFCLSLQAFVPAGFMLGGSQNSWVTLCTSDGLSVQWLDLEQGDSGTSEHSLEKSLCSQSASELVLLPTDYASEQRYTRQLDPSSRAFCHVREPTRAYASRAPPALA